MAKRGHTPRLATYRPIGSPLATASPTGQRRGRPPLGEPHPPLSPHWPPTATPLGTAPLHGQRGAGLSPSPA